MKRMRQKQMAPVPANYFQPLILEGVAALRYVMAPAAERRKMREELLQPQVRPVPQPVTVKAPQRTPRDSGDEMSLRVRAKEVHALNLVERAAEYNVRINPRVVSNTGVYGTRADLCELADSLIWTETDEEQDEETRKIAARVRGKIDAVTGSLSLSHS